jgi:hypothetical protein
LIFPFLELKWALLGSPDWTLLKSLEIMAILQVGPDLLRNYAASSEIEKLSIDKMNISWVNRI